MDAKIYLEYMKRVKKFNENQKGELEWKIDFIPLMRTRLILTGIIPSLRNAAGTEPLVKER
jgi:hypothetical protein